MSSKGWTNTEVAARAIYFAKDSHFVFLIANSLLPIIVRINQMPG